MHYQGHTLAFDNLFCDLYLITFGTLVFKGNTPGWGIKWEVKRVISPSCIIVGLPQWFTILTILDLIVAKVTRQTPSYKVSTKSPLTWYSFQLYLKRSPEARQKEIQTNCPFHSPVKYSVTHWEENHHFPTFLIIWPYWSYQLLSPEKKQHSSLKIFYVCIWEWIN